MRRMLAAVAVAALAWAPAASSPAHAAARELLRVTADGEAKRTYPGIPGNYAATTAAVPTPSGCSGPSFHAVCDTVPIEVVPPAGLDDDDDWGMTIEVTWTPNETRNGVQVNDLDIYFWDDRQIARRDDPSSTSYTRLAESTGATQPEQIAIYAPELGRYNLTVVNWSGPNVNYTVRAWIEVGRFDKPFEVLGPTGTVPDDGGGGFEDDGPAPVDRSAEPAPDAPTAGAGPAENAPPVLAPVPIELDGAFSRLGAGESADERLAADELAAAARRPAPSLPPPQRVGGSTLAFWFGAVPLALLGAGFAVLRRRTRAAIGLG